MPTWRGYAVTSVCVDIDQMSGIETRVERRTQRSGHLWAVTRLSSCLNRDGEWEFEPTPSSRDDAFKARCRFLTCDEAITVYQQTIASGRARRVARINPHPSPRRKDQKASTKNVRRSQPR